jgi:hypothetical protein
LFFSSQSRTSDSPTLVISDVTFHGKIRWIFIIPALRVWLFEKKVRYQRVAKKITLKKKRIEAGFSHHEQRYDDEQ